MNFDLKVCNFIKKGLQNRGRRSGVFIVNFEHISHLFLVFLLMTSKKQMLAEYLLAGMIYNENDTVPEIDNSSLNQKKIAI